MFENAFATRTESAKKCIFPVIHQLDALGDVAYGGRFYDGDMNVLHVNILANTDSDIASSLRADFMTGEPLTDFDKHIQFHTVKYTKAQMETLQKLIDNELTNKFGIASTAYDVKKNRMEIGVPNITDELKAEILYELKKLGFGDEAMLSFVHAERPDPAGIVDFSDSPVDMSNGIADRALDAIARSGVSIKPGSWLGHGDSASAITCVTSLCTGFLYNSTPGFLTCGHGATVGEKIFYQPVPSSGSYPSNLFSYSTSNLTEIGTVAGVYFQSGDAYDCASIRRTNSSANMSTSNFCGGTIDGDSGIPEIGETMAFCGCADGAVFAKCTGNSVSVTLSNGITKTNTITMGADSTPGSSGGCTVYLDGETNKVNLTGLVLARNGDTSWHTKYSLVKSRFNLTTVF